MSLRLASFLRLCLLTVLLAGLVLQPQFPVHALTTLTVTPLTWNVIGLDSNNVNVGPDHFPVGARVCNTGGETATNVTASFQWDSVDPYINLRPGTLSSVNLGTLSAGSCADAYFEVQVTRNSSAYNHTRRYRINVTAGNVTGTISTPTPRELFVEYLVSQNRNAVTDVLYGTSIATLASVPAGGTMTLMVGNTYFIRLVGYTATQGYEQLESFINIPNTIFQVLSVSTTYTADSSATVSSPNDKAYGDACVWENDPNSPNYRSCLSTGKVGGNITVTYQVKILQVPGAPLVNPQPLSSLIYDFSGSSYHYNADYSVSMRYANIVNANITKSFSPKTINPGQTSTLTFTVNNPGPAALTGVNFTDPLPSGVTVAGSTVTYSGCGTPTPASLTVGATSLSFSNISVAGLGSCTVAVSVTASADAIYNNTSGNLFINSTTDTGSFATDVLVVSSKPPAPSTCATRTSMATWTMPTTGQGSGGPPPPYTTIGPNVSSATASAALTAAGTQTIVAGGVTTNAWNITDAWTNVTGAPGVATGPYFQFAVDSSNYGGLQISFQYDLETSGQWAANNNNNIFVYSSADGTNFTLASTTAATKGSWRPAITTVAASSGAATTWFRITAGTRGNQATASTLLDNITISGCPRPLVLTLSKNFSPASIPHGGVSTLTFTFANPNSSALTGVEFSDTLPGGLVINTPNGLATSCSVGTFTGATISAVAGTPNISVSGGTLSANASCTLSVSVRGNVAGQYTNISNSITSAETGPNTTSTGFGTSSLTVVAPPVIAKSFSANPIFTGDSTTLEFDITNPNPSVALTGISFTDTLPAGLDVVNSVTAQCGGTLTVSDNAPAQDTVSLSGGSLAAGGSCSFSVTIAGTTVGLKTNSVTVTSTNGGTGNTSTADVLVKDPAPAINLLKQVGPTASGPWTSFLAVTLPGNVYYRFVVENVGDLPLSAVNVADPTVSTAGCAWVDGDGTSLTAPFTLPVANANDDQVATCVLGPFAAVAGSNPNTATASGTNGITVTDTSTATYGTTALTLVKSVTQTSFTAAGDTLNYSYLVTNSGFAPLLGPVTVTDDKVAVTCPDVSTVGDGDNWFDVGESLTCTATYTVTAGDVTAGFVTNTASATAGGVTSNTDSKTVSTPSDLTVSKTNNVSGSVAQNGTFNWTITVSNIGTGVSSFADGIVILSDPLPGADGYYPQGALTVTPGATPSTGTINCSITGSALSCAASGGTVTLPAGASFSVTFAVNPTAAGSLANTATVDPGGTVAETDETNNTASDTVTVIAPPSISKSFGAAAIPLNGTTTLSFTITNPNVGAALTGVAFTDTLPAGLTVTSATSAQCGGTLTVTAPDSIALTGGTLAAGGSCTFDVTVTGATGGIKNNTTGAVTSTNGGTGNTASASTTVVAPPSIVKTFGSNPIVVNGTSVITFTITNPAANAISLTGVSFTDTYPAGLQNAAVPNASTTCTGGTVTAAANGPSVSLSGATLDANSSCTVTVTVTATTAGTKTNSVTVSSTNGGTGNTSTANLGVISAAKTVVATSEDSTTGNDVAIGEVVRYRLVIDLPEGTTVNLQLLENIVANMAYLNDGSTRVAFICNSGPACASSSTPAIGASPVIQGNTVVAPTFVLPAAAITNNDGGGTGNPFPDGDNPLFSLGTVTNNDNDSDAEYVVLEFNSLVRNTAGNNNGNTRGNTFTVNVNGSALTTTTSGVNDQVTIREPVITAITKSITASPTDAGDTITYQLQFTNSGTAPAFDITVTDALNAVLTVPVTVSGSTTGGNCGSTVSTVSGSYSAPNATATVTCLAAGGTATINITATVSSTALTGYTFGNSASLVYTSLPGTGTVGNPTGSTTPGASGTTNGERNGSGGTNDNVASSNTVSTTLASPSLTKTINPAGTEFAIGATIPYQITITVPEGVTGGPTANLVDTIPTGLSYVAGSLTVTPQASVTIGAAGPYTDANAAFFNLTGQTMTLSFGSFTSTASGSATNRTITVAFLARVDNIVGNQSGTTFTNSVDFTRTNPNAAGTLTLNATAPAVSVVEPDLNVSKAVSSSTPAFNSTLTYTLTVEYTGASSSPAYDAVITDTLPAGLTGLTNVAISSAAPADCASGVVNSSTASALNVTVGTIPLGCTVTITYDVTVSGAVGSTQTNSAAAAWTSGAGSVSGERTGADGPGGALNDYADTASQPVTVSGADFSVVKTDGSAAYTPGTPITYTITVSNTGNAVGTGTVTDNFPASLTSITWTCVGTGGATCTANGTGNISDAVSIPAGQSVTYTVNATVLSSATGNLVNTASVALSVGTDPTPGNNSSTDTDTPDLQADLQVVKTDGADSYTPGGTVTYTVTVTNNGPSDVTGASFNDDIPSQVTEWTWTCVPGTGASCSAGPATSSADFADTIDLPVGSSVTYTVVATISSFATGDLVNTATVATPTGVTDPVPGNNSSTDTNTFAGVPSLTISKTETSTGPYAVGATISYSVVVTNTGATVLTNVVVSDPQLTPSSVTCLSVVQGGTCTLNGTYTVAQSDVDAGNFVNTASVTDDSVCPSAGAGTCEDSVTITFTQTPGLTLTKTAAPTTVTVVGDVITYAFSVQNTGNVTLTNVTLSDSLLSGLNCTTIASLAPNATQSFTCTGNTYTVTQADIDTNGGGDGDLDNTATATATTPGGGTTSDTDAAAVTLPAQNPAHTTTKTETSTGPYAVGDTITYNIVVTNTGNVTLMGVTASDTSAVLGTCTPAQPATLEPDASMTCPASRVVTQAEVDAGSYANTATGDSDQTAPSTSTVTVNFTQTPGLTLTKTATPTTVIAAGNVVTYTFSVQNTGNVTLTNLTLSDSLLSGLNCTAIASLAPNATQSFTCTGNTYTVTQTDIDTNGGGDGDIDNTATVTGTAPGGGTTTDDASVAVTLPAQNPALTLTKAATPTTVTAAGDVVTYTFSVQNTGNVTLTNVTITDNLLTSLNCTAIASLAPNATQSFTCTGNTYTVTQTDIDTNGGGDGDLDNTATATGTAPGGGTTTDDASVAVTLPAQTPAITLTKTPILDDTVVAPPGVVNVGDTITYNFSVQNTGNVTITNITVTDPLLPTLTCAIASLAPGATASCVASSNVYTLTQTDIDAGLRANTATATGSDPGNNPVTDTDTRITALASLPSLNVVKEVSTSAGGPWNDTSVSVTVGDTVYYRVRVANTGNVTLTGLTVDDGMAACTLTRGADITGDNDNNFEVGEEWAYTCSVIAVLGTVDNTATADTNETLADTDTASYTASAALVADPAISKVGDPLQASVGETVTFTLTVTNAGNAPAPNVVVTDVLPAIFDVTAVNVSGAPLGTLVNVTPPIGVGPAPYTVVVTLGGDLGVTDVVTINIVTTVNAQGNPPINNTASLTTTSQTDLVANNTAAVTLTIQPASEVARKVKKLPATGFAPNVVTVVPPQPKELKYAATEVLLEIPSLGVKTTIVGVPLKNGEWNVSWLGNQAGWLEGSAFPSWNGNSVLTSHVYLSNGLPGPFVNLSKLKFGDKVIVHAYGQRYVFEVRTNSVVEPNNVSIFKHEEKSWLTLVTCKEYDEKTNTYKKRVVVRAVLVSVERE